MKTIGTLFALALFVFSAAAATKTWDGSGSGYWSFDANWSGGLKPVNGDDVVFPAGAAHLTNTNDLSGLHLNSITFSAGNYSLQGDSLTVSNGIVSSSTGTDSVKLTVTVAADQTFTCANASGHLYFLSNVVVNTGTTLTASGTGLVGFTGVISGGGKLVKTGTGAMNMSGLQANTYTGTTTVNAGVLELDKSGVIAIGSGLIIGGSGATVREFADDQIAGNVTVNGLGLFDLNGFSDTIMALTLVGGNVTNSTGTLTIAGDVTCGSPIGSSVSTISGKLSLGFATRTFNVLGTAALGGNQLVVNAAVSGDPGVGFTKAGAGLMRLNSGNSYSGVTTVSGGVLQVNSPTALGSTAAGTVLAGGNLEIITGLTINNEWLTNNSSSSTLEVLAGAGPVTWAGNVVLNSNLNVAVVFGGTMKLSGVISGNAGLYKELEGELQYTGASANTYFGTTTVSDGTLRLLNSSGLAFNGPLVIGDAFSGYPTVTCGFNFQLPNWPVTVNSPGSLDLATYGVIEDVGSLTMNSGFVTTGLGTLTLNGNITNYGTSDIFGKLSLGQHLRTFNIPTFGEDDLEIEAVIIDGGTTSGSILQIGSGLLGLGGTNTYTGQTTIHGDLNLYNDHALGANGDLPSGTIITTNAAIHLFGVNVGNEYLVLQEGALWYGYGSGSWAGQINLNGNAILDVESGIYTNTGAIFGPGGFKKDLNGTLIIAGGTPNTYSGTTYVNYGTLWLAKTIDNASVPGPLVIGTEYYGPNTAIVQVNANRQINDAAPVTVLHSGRFDVLYFETIGAFSGDGHVTVPTPIQLRVNSDNSSSTFDGVISGSGSFRKDGSGTLTLTGNNTYTGLTVVDGGKLLVNGLQSQSPVSLSATLGGSGTVGNITLLSGKVAPGNSPGILTCGDVAVTGGGAFVFELNGSAPGTGYDQLKVSGTVDLGAASLTATLGYASAVSNTFVIIDNDGTDAVTGTFSGLPENSTLNVSGIPFRISYTSGTGNDVVLTQLLPLPVLSTLRIANTNLVLLWPTNYTGFTLESNTNLGVAAWAPVAPAPVVNGINYVVTNSTTGTQKFFRLRSP